MSHSHNTEKGYLKEFLLSLSHEERTQFNEQYSLLPANSSITMALMTIGANLIPQGHYSLAKKCLLRGVELADTEQIKARLHLNLAQLYHDIYEKTESISFQENCHTHCQHCLELGYFSEYINKTWSFRKQDTRDKKQDRI